MNAKNSSASATGPTSQGTHEFRYLLAKFVLILVVVIGVAIAVYAIRDVTQKESFWWNFAGVASPTLMVAGFASLIGEFLIRRSFETYLRTQDNRFRMNQELHNLGASIWDDDDEAAVRKMLENDSRVTIIANTGERLTETYFQTIKERFKHENKRLTIVVVDPECVYARVLEQKEVRPLNSLYGTCANLMSGLLQAGANQRNCTVVFHSISSTHAIYMGKSHVLMAPYSLSGSRVLNCWNTTPKLKFKKVHGNDKCPFELVRHDIETLLTHESQEKLVRHIPITELATEANRLRESMRLVDQQSSVTQLRLTAPEINEETSISNGFRNLTDHPLYLIDPNDHSKTLAKINAGKGTAVKFHRKESSTIPMGEQQIRFYEVEGFEIEGLPDIAEGVKLITSTLVAALSGREDCIFPQDHVRDQNGNVIGSSAFARFVNPPSLSRENRNQQSAKRTLKSDQ